MLIKTINKQITPQKYPPKANTDTDTKIKLRNYPKDIKKVLGLKN